MDAPNFEGHLSMEEVRVRLAQAVEEVRVRLA
jgi:hypothetical protein